MSTKVRDDVEKKDVAHSDYNVEPDRQNQKNFLVRQCIVDYPQYFIVGNSYRLIDDNCEKGRSMKLLCEPGPGMMTAVFELNN